MRLIVVDWGTTRLRAFLVENGAIVAKVAADEGVSGLAAGSHARIFRARCGPWLDAHPDAPVLLVGMVGSREGWVEARYAPCPCGPAEIARAMIPVDLGDGRTGHIVPGLVQDDRVLGMDVMRGEETQALGSGVSDGLLCLPGTHSKWIAMREGRVHRFASYFTGEMYALLRHQSMLGRPASEPADPQGFARGLAVAAADAGGADPVLFSHGIAPTGARSGLLHLLFSARAATVTGRLPPDQLGPYLSGLLTGDEVAGALRVFPDPGEVTIIQAPERAALYAQALAARGIASRILDPETALVAGLARIAAAKRDV
jgi:2-dehydro-3-deoxygalactonokinase